MANRPHRVFLDANVLVRPVTRTILMVGADHSGFRVMWSRYAEAEAQRHMGPRKLPLSDLRSRFEVAYLGPSGTYPDRFGATEVSDRQILADAVAADAAFVLTDDVDDFGEADLKEVGLSAVNPDLFVATRLTQRGYLDALGALVVGMTNPSRNVGEMHALIARQHPRLFAAHADLFAVAPHEGEHNEPAVLFRGVCCLCCGTAHADPNSLQMGLGLCCRASS